MWCGVGVVVLRLGSGAVENFVTRVRGCDGFEDFDDERIMVIGGS